MTEDFGPCCKPITGFPASVWAPSSRLLPYFLSHAGSVAPDQRTAQQTTPSGPPPQTGPQAQPDQDTTGGSLSGQLGQTNGVVRPPSGVDPGAVQPTPKVGPQSTPVIPPPGTPGGDQEVKPK